MDPPYGHMAQNTGYAMIAQRYAAALHGYDAAALARIAVQQRFNARHNRRRCSTASRSPSRRCAGVAHGCRVIAAHARDRDAGWPAARR